MPSASDAPTAAAATAAAAASEVLSAPDAPTVGAATGAGAAASPGLDDLFMTATESEAAAASSQMPFALNPPLSILLSVQPDLLDAAEHEDPTGARTPPQPRATRAATAPQLLPAAPSHQPGTTAAEPLVWALRANSIEQVQAALQSDPSAAVGVFRDHHWFGVEPALCMAVRLRCHEKIVSLLLQNSADARSTDPRGRQPLHLLCEGEPIPIPYSDFTRVPSNPDMVGLPQEALYEIHVAVLLLDQGASALCPHEDGGAETCSLRVAERMGKHHLVKLLRARCFRCTINHPVI